MRILLTSLNSKYVHTNLAIRYLQESIAQEFPENEIKEFTINERLERIAAEIYEAKADVIGFSCYIWNLGETLALIRQLRPVIPNTKIIVGGPEVSFDPLPFLKDHPEIDGVVYGEGEITFLELLRAWRDSKELNNIKGLAWRNIQGDPFVNPPREQIPMDSLPNPYTRDEDFIGRLAYVETTRGCPFNCKYCLSSTFQGVRYLSPEKFRIILRNLLQSGARTIKFVDRTFNVDKEHAFKILDIVREEAANYPPDAGIRAHCEIAGELLDDDWVNYLNNYPDHLVQFEVGVQSTNPQTLSIISRPQQFEKWAHYITKIKNLNKVHLHLDLIAGLPEEDWTSFRKSFNDVYTVQPDMLQLGFLKVLKGSGLRENSKKYGLTYSPNPPYTILETNVLSHGELLKLHRLEDILDRYYNSGKFATVLPLIIKNFQTPFDFYHQFAEYWHQQGWFKQSWSAKAAYEKLWQFVSTLKITQQEKENIRNLLLFDYYLWERPNVVPEYLLPPVEYLPDNYKETKYHIQQNPNWYQLIPHHQTMDKRQWSRATAVEYFTYPTKKWVLFFYNKGRSQAYTYDDSLSQLDGDQENE